VEGFDPTSDVQALEKRRGTEVRRGPGREYIELRVSLNINNFYGMAHRGQTDYKVRRSLLLNRLYRGQSEVIRRPDRIQCQKKFIIKQS
jgi:hypothetical protein